MTEPGNPSLRFFENSKYTANRFNIEIRRRILWELLGDLHGKVIVDLGCGDGSLSLMYAAGNQLVLVDGARNMVAEAKSQAELLGVIDNVEFIHVDFLQSMPEISADVVICVGVFSHVNDSNRLLELLSASMKAEGVLVIQISDIDHGYYQRKQTANQGYGYQLTRTGLTDFFQLMEKHGFRLRDQRSYQWSFFPLNRMPHSLQIAILDCMRTSGWFRQYEAEHVFLYVR